MQFHELAGETGDLQQRADKRDFHAIQALAHHQMLYHGITDMVKDFQDIGY